MELHPFVDEFADADLSIIQSYFDNDDSGPVEWNEPGTYTDGEAATVHNQSYEWTRPVSRVIQSLLDRGTVLGRFVEHDFTVFGRWPFLVNTEGDAFRMPEGMPSLPLMYSIRLRRKG